VDDEFLVCPVCTTRLRQACTSCGKPLEAAWQVCPYCETPIAADDATAATAPQPQRRRRARPANS
jgi:predicted amidophosphoribosyltransferase